MNSPHPFMYICIFLNRKTTNFCDTSKYGFFNKPCNVSKIKQIEIIVSYSIVADGFNS